ncbi:LAFE_0D12552g1_1 [Lachancea fermentati]|uniref:Acetyl-coenzyme A synthetase n=1 Tax=Lachancea fermentati TaxID=4955 RepID=A0A1G4MCL2_LACFM|nr:LAFE_0D12552g1_1 [Lachancea fermentati]
MPPTQVSFPPVPGADLGADVAAVAAACGVHPAQPKVATPELNGGTTTTTATATTNSQATLTPPPAKAPNAVPAEREHLTDVPMVTRDVPYERIAASLAAHYAPYLPGGFAQYREMYQQSLQQPAQFFGERARALLTWVRPFERAFFADALGAPSFDSNAWFLGGQLNACYNMLDRHAFRHPDKVAVAYEADEPGEGYQLTYRELLAEVCKMAQVLTTTLGVRKGDTVAVYMPMIPQALIALLAISRIGAVHSVVFAGFSSNSLRDRIRDAGSEVVITIDESRRGGKTIETKRIVDEALKQTPQVRHVLVYRRTGSAHVAFHAPRDLDWDTEIRKYKPYCPCEPVDAEHPLFLLYTSGSTGVPKGMQHATAGYLLQAMLTMQYSFDTHADDVVFTAGDIGWITGHTYVLYGPLLCGCTTVVYEGTPAYPNFSRYWEIIDRLQVTHFYVAPTALRLLKRAGDAYLQGFSLRSLRCLGSVGEPIAREVWEWYSDRVGHNEIPIIDTYWQTESGAHIITPLAGVTPMKPGSVSMPFFGVELAILDPITGHELGGNEVEGVLAIKRPWPSFARTIWRNHERFLDIYFKPYPGYFFTGDSVARDRDGFIWILGRVDDVVNVSGHRLSTAEIEAAIIEDNLVAECAVVGFADELTGQAVAAFVVLKNRSGWADASEDELQSIKKRIIVIVRKDIGSFATPKLIVLVDDLPKTRSGKIMRRILRKILAGEADKLGDVSTLSNPGVVKHLIDSVKV